MNTSRRQFLAKGLLTTAALGVAGSRMPGADQPELARPAPLDRDLVFRMVRVAHSDLAQVTALLEQQPNLANATWDWGGGDWETPLEAAAHVGHRAIARYLLAHGARHSLFASAMLGDRDSVAAAVKTVPAIVNTRGPHGNTLLYHAASSGDIAMAELIKPHLATPAVDFNQAVHAATRDRHPDMLTWLFANGVTDPNTRDFRGRTPLKVAQEQGSEDLAEILRAHRGTE